MFFLEDDVELVNELHRKLLLFEIVACLYHNVHHLPSLEVFVNRFASDPVLDILEGNVKVFVNYFDRGTALQSKCVIDVWRFIQVLGDSNLSVRLLLTCAKVLDARPLFFLSTL